MLSLAGGGVLLALTMHPLPYNQPILLLTCVWALLLDSIGHDNFDRGINHLSGIRQTSELQPEDAPPYAQHAFEWI